MTSQWLYQFYLCLVSDSAYFAYVWSVIMLILPMSSQWLFPFWTCLVSDCVYSAYVWSVTIQSAYAQSVTLSPDHSDLIVNAYYTFLFGIVFFSEPIHFTTLLSLNHMIDPFDLVPKHIFGTDYRSYIYVRFILVSITLII